MKKAIFLHHSTGKSVWLGSTNRIMYKLTKQSDVTRYFKKYNKKNKTDFHITEQKFPAQSPYGWKNYPFDYYNIWVKNAGKNSYLGEPTLEILTREYDLIIFKHCYDVSRILPDSGSPDINSEIKSIENYKLQYNALKKKMHEFPDNCFIIWTPATFIKGLTTQDEAERTRQFYKWMMDEWNEEGDNIFIWDFYKFETEDGLYMIDEYSSGPNNSHPGKEFSSRVSLMFSEFIIEVLNAMYN